MSGQRPVVQSHTSHNPLDFSGWIFLFEAVIKVETKQNPKVTREKTTTMRRKDDFSWLTEFVS